MKFYGYGIGKDVKIQTSKKLLRAESIKKYDEIVDHDSEDAFTVYIKESTSLGFIRICTEANFKVVSAPFQKFATESGFMAAEDIQENDLVYTVKGLLKILEIKNYPCMLSTIRFMKPEILFSAGGLLTLASNNEIHKK